MLAPGDGTEEPFCMQGDQGAAKMDYGATISVCESTKRMKRQKHGATSQAD